MTRCDWDRCKYDHALVGRNLDFPMRKDRNMALCAKWNYAADPTAYRMEVQPHGPHRDLNLKHVVR
jgi:hypothetical protein